MLRWYLIRTKPSSEAVALANLCRQGYEVHFPRLARAVRRGTRRLEQVVPLFPGYLFLRLREGLQALGPVNSSVGVTGVVRFGSRYAVVPDQVISDLASRADPESGLHRLADPQPLSPGASVRIVAGPFNGLEGVFQREAGHERVVVLLRLLGHNATVRVANGMVVPGWAA